MGKIAVIFAGQGTQHPGMGKEIHETSSAARKVMETLKTRFSGIENLCFDSDAEALKITKNTQPAMFAVEMMCAAALEERGVTADFTAGFSLGEVAAAAYSGLLSLENAFDYVIKRGELMSACAEKRPGGMAAVLRLEPQKVEEICGKYPGLYPVNYNCPGQVVVAGSIGSVEQMIADMPDYGGKALKLNVSGAFHTPFMEEACGELEKIIKDYTFNTPKIPVLSNVTADFIAPALMPLQVKSPVLWEQTLRRMAAEGVDVFVEAGPGKVLGGFVKKTLPQAVVLNVEDAESLEKTVLSLKERQNI